MARGIFKPIPPDTPVRAVANVTDMEFIRNFIDDIQGIGCTIDIPVFGNGLGATITIGNGTDLPYPPNIDDPFTGTAATETNYSFKVTHNTGNTYDIEGGTVWVLNQSATVADSTAWDSASASLRYIRLKVTVLSTGALSTVIFDTPKTDETDATHVPAHTHTHTHTHTSMALLPPHVSSGVAGEAQRMASAE